MKILPIAHGFTNNLYASAKSQGIRFKLILFFDTGYAYVMKSTKYKEEIIVDEQLLYNDLKIAVEAMDFILLTKEKDILIHQFEELNQLMKHSVFKSISSSFSY